MRCPFCGNLKDKVLDSRISREGDLIRRRRACLQCAHRYTSYERVEQALPAVIKKRGAREPFDRQKILSGLKKACEKRPIDTDLLESIVNQIERKVQEMGTSEIDSRLIGEEVMLHLNAVDPVAYVRFASVYREFKDIGEFMSEIQPFVNKP